MTKPKGNTLADFRAQYDRNVVIPNRIRAAIAELAAAGEENWEYENEFMKRAKIGQSDISAFRDQFAAYVLEARAVGGSPRKIWFASAKVAAKARGEV